MSEQHHDHHLQNIEHCAGIIRLKLLLFYLLTGRWIVCRKSNVFQGDRRIRSGHGRVGR